MTLPPVVNYVFEGALITVALAATFRAAWKGNPRPSAFLTALFVFAAIGSSIGNKAKTEMFLAWSLALISLLIGVFVKHTPAVATAGKQG